MKTLKAKNYIGFLGPLIFFLLVLLAWQIISNLKLIPTVLFPNPTEVLNASLTMLKNGRLLSSLLVSVGRILAGFLLSVIVAVPLGLYLGFSKKSRQILEPALAFLRYIPPSAFIPLMIVWFGISETQKIMFIFLAIAPYLCLMVADAAGSIKKEFIHAALTLGAKPTDILFRIITPHTMPQTWESGRIMLGASWSFVILSEIVGSNKGLGHLITESQRYLQTANIFAAIIAIGLIGLISDILLRIISKKIFPWFYHA